MKPKHHDPDYIDLVISDTLKDYLGPGPSPDVWARIATEVQRPPRRRFLDWLRAFLRVPVVQSAVLVALLVLLVGPPTVEELTETPLPHPVPTTLPYTSAQERPVPAAELQEAEQADEREDERDEAEEKEAEADEDAAPASKRLPPAYLQMVESP